MIRIYVPRDSAARAVGAEIEEIFHALPPRALGDLWALRGSARRVLASRPERLDDWPAFLRDRAPAQLDLAANTRGMGRELFSLFRANACSAEHGGTAFPDYDPI